MGKSRGDYIKECEKLIKIINELLPGRHYYFHRNDIGIGFSLIWYDGQVVNGDAPVHSVRFGNPQPAYNWLLGYIAAKKENV